MINSRPTTPRNHPVKPAMSIVEVLVSVMLVGVMLTAALETLGAAKVGQSNTGYRKVAHLLAHDLMAEILSRDYEEGEEPVMFGPELTEGAKFREDFDDVDDYDAWSASPPQYKDGEGIPDRTGWRRAVDIDYVNPNDTGQISAVDLGVKRIIVTVTHHNVELARLIAIRTRAADHLLDILHPAPNSDPIPLPPEPM